MLRVLTALLTTALAVLVAGLTLLRFQTEQFDTHATVTPTINHLRLRKSIPESIDDRSNIIRLLNKDELLEKIGEAPGVCEIPNRRDVWLHVRTGREEGWVAVWYVTTANVRIQGNQRIHVRTGLETLLEETKVWCVRHPVRMTMLGLFLGIAGFIMPMFQLIRPKQTPGGPAVTIGPTPPEHHLPIKNLDNTSGRGRAAGSSTIWVPRHPE